MYNETIRLKLFFKNKNLFLKKTHTTQLFVIPHNERSLIYVAKQAQQIMY